jgi:hypothetical protein
MAGPWNAERMLELGRRHAELEARCDLEGTLATLTDAPVYEFFPVGLELRGVPSVRRYYEHLFSHFVPMTASYRLVSEWVNERSVAQEYEISLRGGGGLETHRVIGILVAEGELLGGERVYASERCIRHMLGDLFEELSPVTGT